MTALERIQAVLGADNVTVRSEDAHLLHVEAEVAALQGAFPRLRAEADFETLSFVTALDHGGGARRFEVCYQLLSLSHNERLRISTFAVGDPPTVPSSTPTWDGASFLERECFDMFGVHFEGHPDLRRLLMPEGFDHYPLRKEFPHQGIEPDRLYREWERSRS